MPAVAVSRGVSRHREERRHVAAQSVDRSHIQRMIALAHVEGATVHLHALNRARDIYVRVRVAVSVRVRRQIIRHQVRSHPHVLRDGLAVVTRHTRREILRRLDAARRGIDGIAGNRNGRARPSGFASSKSSVANTFTAGSGDITSPLVTSAVTTTVSRHFSPAAGVARSLPPSVTIHTLHSYFLVMCRAYTQFIRSWLEHLQCEPSLGVAHRSPRSTALRAQFHRRARNRIALPVAHGSQNRNPINRVRQQPRKDRKQAECYDFRFFCEA